MKHYLLAILFAAAAFSCKETKKIDNTVVVNSNGQSIENNQDIDSSATKHIEKAAPIDSAWQKSIGHAKGIIALYDSIRLATPEDERELHILNQCHFVWQSGEYMFSCRGKNRDIYELPKHRFDLSLDDAIVNGFISKKNIGKFVKFFRPEIFAIPSFAHVDLLLP